MGKYVYEFGRCGVLFRKNGVTITDSFGNYIAGKPMFVPWWPVNWLVFATGIPVLAARNLWRYLVRPARDPR